MIRFRFDSTKLTYVETRFAILQSKFTVVPSSILRLKFSDLVWLTMKALWRQLSNLPMSHYSKCDQSKSMFRLFHKFRLYPYLMCIFQSLSYSALISNTLLIHLLSNSLIHFLYSSQFTHISANGVEMMVIETNWDDTVDTCCKVVLSGRKLDLEWVKAPKPTRPRWLEACIINKTCAGISHY